MAENALWAALKQTWPAQVANAFYGAVTLPGDVYAGRVAPGGEEAIGRAADLAGMLGMGGLATASARTGALGAFGGKVAAASGANDVMQSTPRWAQDAFDLGRLVRDAKEVHPVKGRAFYEDWAYGRIPKLTEDQFNSVNRWDMNDPNRNAFYLSGAHGDDLPVWTSGTRYGFAPKDGRSWNYREQLYEPGVSMASVEHPRFADWKWFDAFNKDRPVLPYEGYLLPMKGTDDEPLMVALQRLGQGGAR